MAARCLFLCMCVCVCKKASSCSPPRKRTVVCTYGALHRLSSCARSVATASSSAISPALASTSIHGKLHGRVRGRVSRMTRIMQCKALCSPPLRTTKTCDASWPREKWKPGASATIYKHRASNMYRYIRARIIAIHIHVVGKILPLINEGVINAMQCI